MTPTQYRIGDRVNTPHGPGTITQNPFQMTSGWTARVELDNPGTVTVSGHIRAHLDDITPADDTPMTAADAEAHFRAMGIPIIDNITIV